MFIAADAVAVVAMVEDATVESAAVTMANAVVVALTTKASVAADAIKIA